MKDQLKFIKTIVLLTTATFFINGWLEGYIGRNVTSFLTSIGAISMVGYGLYLAWDNWLWKQKWLSFLLCKLVGFYDYPVLQGKWNLNFESTYRDGTKGTGEATILQTYSSLFIEGNFGQNSNFDTFFAQLKQKENGKWFLVYAYRNRPKSSKLTNSPSGGMHEGFAYLDVVGKNKLEGYYSNDENRKTRGKLIYTKSKVK